MESYKSVRAHTILFTEECPLDCRYCELQLEEDYNTCAGQTFEFIHTKIQQYYEQDKADNMRTQLTFTGGEPLLYWNWIKDIITEYGDRMNYHFNTSGYLFTPNMLAFLSQYKVFFTLSIDGGLKLTNYLRPVKGTMSHTGYFKKMAQIIPTLTYYFPDVIAKLIINNRCVDLLYENYLELERAGFKTISLIIDFNSRPYYENTTKQTQRVWNTNDTKILQEQLELIAKEIVAGFANNINRMQISNFNDMVKFLLQDLHEYNPDNLFCKVFSGRTLETLTNSKDRTCFDGMFNSLQDAKQGLIDAFNAANGKCPIDEKCPVFLYCANFNCPISSFHATKSWFGCDHLECIMAKCSYFAALSILQTANDICSESEAYLQYLNQFDFKGKEEYLNGFSNPFLPLQ